MGLNNYFFDSYAVIELTKGNFNYAKYIKEEMLFTIFNLAEIYWSALNFLGEDEANLVYERHRESVVEIDDEVLKEAMKFKKEHKKRRLSYTDCIGYVYSLRHKLIFLTGDKEFKGMKNVEFVK